MKDPLAWFDRLPVGVQHAILLAVATAVTIGVSVIPSLNIPFPYDVVLGAVATWAAAWASKITRQYGRGSDTAFAVVPDPADEEKGH